MPKKQDIDDAQPSTVDEHFRLLVEDDSTIETEMVELSKEDLPGWFDAKLFKKGQDTYMNNLLSMGIASVTGLIAILAVPETLEVLIFTKQSSGTCVAFKRYTQTVLHIYNLHYKDILDPKSKWFDDLNVIRWKHVIANKRAKKAGLGGIYHRDMAITQFGFFGFALLRQKELGLSCTSDEIEGLLHFWRVVGHMLGISDRLNICRRRSEETIELCKRIAEEILVKHMSANKPEYLELARHVVNGMWYIDMSLDTEAFLAQTYQLAGTTYKESLTMYSYLNMKYREVVLYLCGAPYIGVLVKTYYYYLLVFIYWLVGKYPISAWLAFGRENTKINLYPKIR